MPACLLFVLALLLAGTSAYAEGPLPVRNQYPLESVHLSLAPQSGAVLPEGSFRLVGASGWTNSFILRDHYIVDAENVDTRAELAAGIGNGTEVSISIPYLWRGGGTLDRGIDDWHRFWGFPRGHRGKVRQNQFSINGVRHDGTPFSVGESGGSWGNFSAGLKHTLPGFESDHMAVLGELSLPELGGYGHEGLEGLAGLAYTHPEPWGALYADLALVGLEDRYYDEIPFAPLHGEGYAGAEYRITDSVSALGGLSFGSKTIEGISGYPEYFCYLDVGTRIRTSETLSWDLAMRENPAPHNGTADISLYAAAEVSW